MSKRSGDMVTLDELVDDIGVDAARSSVPAQPETPIDLDLDLARSSRARTPSTTSSTRTPGSPASSAKPARAAEAAGAGFAGAAGAAPSRRSGP